MALHNFAHPGKASSGYIDKILISLVENGNLSIVLLNFFMGILILCSLGMVLVVFILYFGRAEVFYLWSVWKIFQPEKTAKESLSSPYRYDTNKVRKVLHRWGRGADTKSLWNSRFILQSEWENWKKQARNAARLVENLPSMNEALGSILSIT